MKTLTNQPLVCPHCEREVIGCVSAGNYPSLLTGQWTLCTFCGGISLVTEELDLRLATAEEMDNLKTNFPATYEHMMITQQYYIAQDDDPPK